jgi:hypothetical protein
VTDVTFKKWRQPFLDALAQHGNVSRAAKVARISRNHLYRARHDDPDFAAQWDAAKDRGLDSLEDVANARARKDSDTLLIFLLKAHRPEKYRDTYNINHGGQKDNPIQVFDHSAITAALAAGSGAYRDPSGTDEGDSDGSEMG